MQSHRSCHPPETRGPSGARTLSEKSVSLSKTKMMHNGVPCAHSWTSLCCSFVAVMIGPPIISTRGTRPRQRAAPDRGAQSTTGGRLLITPSMSRTQVPASVREAHATRMLPDNGSSVCPSFTSQVLRDRTCSEPLDQSVGVLPFFATPMQPHQHHCTESSAKHFSATQRRLVEFEMDAGLHFAILLISNSVHAATNLRGVRLEAPPDTPVNADLLALIGYRVRTLS